MATFRFGWFSRGRTKKRRPLKPITKWYHLDFEALEVRWLWIALAAAALALGASAPVALAWWGPPRPEVEASALPGNLTDILNVECR